MEKRKPLRAMRCFVCQETLAVGVLHLYCPGCARWICTHKPALLCPVYQGKPNVYPFPVKAEGGVVDVDWREDPRQELPAPPPALPAATEEDEWP